MEEKMTTEKLALYEKNYNAQCKAAKYEFVK